MTAVWSKIHRPVEVVAQCFSAGASLVLPLCFPGASLVLPWCFPGASLVLPFAFCCPARPSCESGQVGQAPRPPRNSRCLLSRGLLSLRKPKAMVTPVHTPQTNLSTSNLQMKLSSEGNPENAPSDFAGVPWKKIWGGIGIRKLCETTRGSSISKSSHTSALWAAPLKTVPMRDSPQL